MRKFVLLLVGVLLLGGVVYVSHSQTPQTDDVGKTQPLFGTNAKYVQGIGVGYWPTCTNGGTAPCSGLTLYIGPGTAICGVKRTYAGGSLTLDNNATSYIKLDASSACVPNNFNTPFTGSDAGLTIATVTTSGGTITTIVDDRTHFGQGSGGGGGGILLQTNESDNGNQALLDLADGAGISITDNGSGKITVAATGLGVKDTSLIYQFPPVTMKGSFVGATFYNGGFGGAIPNLIPAFYHGSTVGSCGARSYVPIAGWLRNVSLTTTTTQGDGQIETIKPFANCTFNGMGGSGLSIEPTSSAGSYYTVAGMYRVERLNGLDFSLDYSGTAGSSQLGNPLQYAVPSLVGAEFTADDQIVNGNMWNLLGGFGALAPLANTTYYSGPGLTFLWTTETAFPLVLPVDGTLKYFAGSMVSTGGGVTTTVTVRKNLADTALAFVVGPYTGAINGQVGAHIDLSNSVSVTAGDTVDWKIAQAAGAPGGNFVNFMLGFNPTNNTSALIYGNLGIIGFGGTFYFAPFSDAHFSTENLVGYTLPHGGVASKLYLYIGTPIGAGSDIFTIEKNGADTTLTCTITSSNSGVVACDLAHTVTFATKDRIALKQVYAAGTFPPGTWSLVID